MSPTIANCPHGKPIVGSNVAAAPSEQPRQLEPVVEPGIVDAAYVSLDQRSEADPSM